MIYLENSQENQLAKPIREFNSAATYKISIEKINSLITY